MIMMTIMRFAGMMFYWLTVVFTGGPTEYIHLPNGARIIELNEGARTFKTWIRTKAGVEQLTTYPDSFVKE